MKSMPRLLSGALLLLLSVVAIEAAPPAWWAQRGATDANAPRNDYGAANVGQAKNVAAHAVDELNEWLPHGGAGPQLNAMVRGWRLVIQNGTATGNRAPLNHGQLKTLAKPFYDRLRLFGFRGRPLVERVVIENRVTEKATILTPYPWTTATSDDRNYAVANIGQVKHVFSFDIAPDTDGDGMRDAWELAHGLNPSLATDAAADADGDGVTNLQEFLARSDPKRRADRGTVSGATYLVVIAAPSGAFFGVANNSGALTGLNAP